MAGDLENIITMEAIKKAGVHIGADPLGGRACTTGAPPRQRRLSVVGLVDPQWGFMTLDEDPHGSLRRKSASIR
jgi:phosphoglucomutase